MSYHRHRKPCNMLLVFFFLVITNLRFWTKEENSTSPCHVVTSQYYSLATSCDPNSSMIFDDIYTTGTWGSRIYEIEDTYNNAQFPPPNRNPASGLGSSLGHATVNALSFLRNTIRNYSITSMIDIPCGDTNWIFDSFETDSLSLYIGLDISEKIIALNKKRYAHHHNKLFQLWDGSRCDMPKYFNNSLPHTVDLIHSRDVIQHLPLVQGKRFLCNVVLSKSLYFITTTFDSKENRDVKAGDYYENNLRLAPFFFTLENLCIKTHPDIEPDRTCLYELKQPFFKNWSRFHCNNNYLLTV
jgi:hypothetical protein